MNRNTADGFEAAPPLTPDSELLKMIAQDLEELHRMIGEWVDLDGPRRGYALAKIEHAKQRYGLYVPAGERQALLLRQYALKRAERVLGRPSVTVQQFDEAFKKEWTPILNGGKKKEV